MTISQPKNHFLLLLICIIGVLTFAFAIWTILRDFTTWRPAYSVCADGSECKRLAQLFATDYAESKDLAKSFLTILVAVFVASITFSEKIVDVNKSGRWSKAAMIGCWVSFLAAIVACGTAVGYMAMAYGVATYEPNLDYHYHEIRAVFLFLAAGVFFGLGLCLMLLAGLTTFLGSAQT